MIFSISNLFYDDKEFITMTVYYFAIASEKFLLKEEPIEEILRERMNYYNNHGRVIDFWLVKDPDFLRLPEMSKIRNRLNTTTASIVSTNPLFINWLKLRIGFVITGYFINSKAKFL